MGEGSHISWTDNTFNYWIGCTKVSAGCDNCYAEREQDLRYGRAKWGKGNERYLTSEANRRTPFKWERQAVAEGRRIRVFTASLSDVFDEEVSDEWRDGLFDIIRATPHLDWLVLTKRLAKMLRYTYDVQFGRTSSPQKRMPPNIWWGCSVEDQATANQRIPELLKMRQFVGDAPLWLSVEPLIGPINVELISRTPGAASEEITEEDDALGPIFGGAGGIDWVVVGGESGPNARPMHPDWPRSLRDQCVAAGVAFHFKQLGEWIGVDDMERLPLMAPQLADPSEYFAEHVFRSGDHCHGVHCGAIPVYRVGKKAAGRLLDGREWNEFPAKRGVESKEGSKIT